MSPAKDRSSSAAKASPSCKKAVRVRHYLRVSHKAITDGFFACRADVFPLGKRMFQNAVNPRAMMPISANKKLKAHVGSAAVTSHQGASMLLKFRVHTLIVLPIALSLVACGGGGEEISPPVASPANFPLSLVAEALIKEHASFAVRIEGTVTQGRQSIPLTGTGTYSVSNTTSTFEGAPSIRRSSTTTGTIGASGISIPVADTGADYFGVDFKPLGRVASGAYCVYTNQTHIPAAATIGQSGTWYSGTCYTNSTKASRLGTTEVSYVLEADTASTATLKLIYKITGTGGQAASSTSAYRITTSGGYTRVSESASVTEGGMFINLTISFP